MLRPHRKTRTGCTQCRRRRVKCDERKPLCANCDRNDLRCSLEFLTPMTPLSQSRCPTNESLQDSIVVRKPPSLVSVALSTPIEIHAFHYWVENFTAWPKDLLDMGHEYSTYTLEYSTYALCHWNFIRSDSSIYLAASAFSLAAFGAARHSNEAFEKANRFLARSIIKTRKEIKELSNETIDQLVVATMLMASYDIITSQFTQCPRFLAADDVGSRFFKNACHYKGAACLLQVRQQQGYSPNASLDRAVRRQIIQLCILRGDTVQEWLQDGVLYVEGPILTLDSLMIRVAALRYKSLELCRDKNFTLLSCINKLKDIALDAQELDFALVAWPQGIPKEWNLSIHPSAEGLETRKPDLVYRGYVHTYLTRGQAAIWIRYCAVRLIVNSICMRLLCALAEFTPQGPSINSSLEACQANINSLATDICCSVPCFFNSYNTMPDMLVSKFTRINDIPTSSECEITPKLAAILAWPLAVAVSTEGVPKAQKLWLQLRLKAIASVIGAPVLSSVADKGEFKF